MVYVEAPGTPAVGRGGGEMFRELLEINRRPAPFEVGSPAELWTDEHVSSRMLELHLDGSLDVASRKTETIARSVDWMAGRIN